MSKVLSIKSYLNFIFSILFILTVCLASYSAQNNYNSIETEIFILKLPSYMKQLKVPDYITQDSSKNSFTFIYAEVNKESRKSILLIITGEKERNIKSTGEIYALNIMAKALKDYVTKKEHNSQISDLTKTKIDNSEARYFDVNCSDCKIKIAKYWCFIKGEYFITVNLVKPTLSEDAVFRELEQAIKSLKFKEQ